MKLFDAFGELYPPPCISSSYMMDSTVWKRSIVRVFGLWNKEYFPENEFNRIQQRKNSWHSHFLNFKHVLPLRIGKILWSYDLWGNHGLQDGKCEFICSSHLGRQYFSALYSLRGTIRKCCWSKTFWKEKNLLVFYSGWQLGIVKFLEDNTKEMHLYFMLFALTHFISFSP